MTTLLAFLGVVVVVIITPGPDTVLTIRSAVGGGRRSGVLTAAGVAVGQLTWTVATAAGLSALMQSSQLVFGWLKLLGAAYLVYLGVQSLASAVRRRRDVAGLPSPLRLRGAVAFRSGLVSNLANPKMVAFFLSLLPHFLPLGWSPFAGFLVLGSICCLLTFGWLSLYAVVLGRARGLVDRTAVRRALEAVAGTALVALGIRMAVDAVRR